MSDNHRRLPIKTKEIELNGDYAGWTLTVRTNPPISAFGHIASGEFDRIVLGLSRIVRVWNFVDENGDPLEAPSQETIGELPLDLLTAIANKYVTELSALPPA